MTAADAGNERQVIVPTPACIAASPPVAHVALLDGLGVVVVLHIAVRPGNRGQQIGAHAAVVRRVVVHAVAVHLVVWRHLERRHDMEVLGRHALEPREQIRVERELQDGAAARLACELRVPRLVGPRAEAARHAVRERHAAQDVGIAHPSFPAQRRLDHDVRAISKRRLGAREARLAVITVGEVHHREPLRAQPLHIARLVLDTPLAERRQERIVERGFLKLSRRHGHVEPGAVAAPEEGGEVGGRQDKLAV